MSSCHLLCDQTDSLNKCTISKDFHVRQLILLVTRWWFFCYHWCNTIASDVIHWLHCIATAAATLEYRTWVYAHLTLRPTTTMIMYDGLWLSWSLMITLSQSNHYKYYFQIAFLNHQQLNGLSQIKLCESLELKNPYISTNESLHITKKCLNSPESISSY